MLCWECQKNSENKKSQENKMLDIFRILNNILILKPRGFMYYYAYKYFWSTY